MICDSFNPPTQQIILYHHLGLGDHFICNGLVNYISQKVEIVLPCKQHNYATVQCLYINNKALKVVPIVNEEHDIFKLVNETQLPLFKVGFDYLNTTSTIWYDAFYEHIGLHPTLRHTMFTLPQEFIEQNRLYLENSCHSTPYIVVHDSSSVVDKYPIDFYLGRNISDLPNIITVRPNQSNNLLAWTKVFQNAQEIHAVNSSVYWLLDSMPNLKSKLYYHDIRLGDPILPNNRWQYINYSRKI
jgi:hypothetical protein